MKKKYSRKAVLKFIGYSLIGIFFFFIPVRILDKTTIPIDHLVNLFKNYFSGFSKIFVFATIFLGSIYPFYKQSWNRNKTEIFFAIFKLLGLFFAITYIFKIGPTFLFEKDLLPFLFEKLVVPVGLIVPIGAIFLAFLVDFGLLEFFGGLLEKIMRPLWKTPGRSAIDALASFVGSYSIALLITDKVYSEGKYTTKEAVIIATGFSTVSAPFMIIVAKTTDLINYWSFFFFSTLITTFIVTALTVRIPPISDFENGDEKFASEKFSVKDAISEAITVAEKSKPVFFLIRKNLSDGLRMSMSILPTILSIGLSGLLIAKFTSFFDFFGYIFYPVVKILGLPNTLLISKAAAIELAEMFLPSLLIAKAELISRYVVAVTSISSILFFSASIPTILATRIPLKPFHLIIIWFERTIFSLIISSFFAYLFLI